MLSNSLHQINALTQNKKRKLPIFHALHDSLDLEEI